MGKLIRINNDPGLTREYEFDEIYNMYQRLIESILSKDMYKQMDKEDMRSELNMTLFKCYTRYDNEKYSISHNNSESMVGFSHYAKTILNFEAHKYIRNKTHYRRKEGERDCDYVFSSIQENITVKRIQKDDKSLAIGDVLQSNFDFEQIDNAILIRHIIGSISNDNYRKILILTFFYDLKQEDISRLLNVSQSTVSRAITKTLNEIKKNILGDK